MYVIASVDRIRELQREFSTLMKLNDLYKANPHSNDFTFRAHRYRSVRLVEIRAELGAMKRPY